MTDGPTSESLRRMARQYIDPRGRPSNPGPPNAVEIATEEAAMRRELYGAWEMVEGYERKSKAEERYGICPDCECDNLNCCCERKSPGAGNLEAAGIEPASHPLPNGSSSRGFEHWKLDGKVAQDAVDRGEAYWLEEPIPSGRFSAKTTIADFELAAEDGQLFIYVNEGLGSSEPLETAIPKLAALLGAARLVANSE